MKNKSSDDFMRRLAVVRGWFADEAMDTGFPNEVMLGRMASRLGDYERGIMDGIIKMAEGMMKSERPGLNLSGMDKSAVADFSRNRTLQYLIASLK